MNYPTKTAIVLTVTASLTLGSAVNHGQTPTHR
jgi:hypothetical protein